MEQRKLLAAVIPNFVGGAEIGEVETIAVDSNWSTVNLDRSFDNPVVIAGPASLANGDALNVRVRNVSSTSFQIALDEWDYLDGNHPAEIVSYMVVEGGMHTLEDGTRLVAGYVNDQTDQWETISTGNFFVTRPVLFSQIMTDNDPSSATTRMVVASNNVFVTQIQEEEAADNVHAAETIGFVAVATASSGNSGGSAFQSLIVANPVTHTGATVSLDGGGFDSTPALFASMQSNNSADTATVRSIAVTANSATFFIQEEQSQDVELVHTPGEIIGVLAIDNGMLATSSGVQPSGRFSALEEHILGTDTMNVGELQSWATAFANEANTIGNRLEDFVAAVEVVELYEAEVGPLFTPAGLASFNNSWDGDVNLGRGLGRTMMGVYQAIFDAFDSDLVSQSPNLVDGVMFRSTEYFPGTVPTPTDPNAIYEVQIDGTLNEQYGSDGGYNTNAARRMTGAYLAPGTIAEVIVPNELVNAGYQIRVGGHSWDLSNKNTANRLHRVSNTFDITGNVTQVANPMGGNIYIEVPIGGQAGIVDIQFRNTIRAPFFSNRSFDQTSATQWETVERNHPGAFTDIESEHSLWTVPTKWVDNVGYNQLIEIIEAHDANIQVASEYAGKDAQRHKAILYMIVDTQIRGNAFSIGYPQSNYGSFNQNTIRAPLTLQHAFDKVLWHEHGHAELVTMFSGETESLVHMVAVSIGMENYGLTAQEAFAESLAYGSTNHDTSDTLNSWVVMDEFLNGQNMAFQQGSYRPRGHADYVEYIDMFGLEALQNFNRRINIEMDGLEWDQWTNGGRTSHNRNDRLLRLSREAGVNVAPLFHLWGHSPSNASALATAMAAEGLRPSVEIYDRMVTARDSVPLNQAQWNAVDGVMRDFLNESRGPWAALRSNYDVARGQAAVARIQELIDLHFPSGRPVEGPAVEPIAAKVVAFSDANYGGDPWELTEGTYLNVDLDAGPIGNDAISSFLIPAGYEVTVYQWAGGTGTTATYTESISALGLLDNDISRIEITSTLQNQQAIGESNSISVDHLWKTVTLTQSYNDPVVIAGTPSYEGTDPSTVRIRNVTSNSFEIRIDEWEYLNPIHASEVVSYMVIEAGQYTLDDGTIFVAGNRSGQDHNVQTYSLGSAFAGLETPLVFANVVTEFDPAAVTTRVNMVSNTEFEVSLQEEEAADGIHGAETISFFAVESGAGATGGLHYDAGSFEAGSEGQFVNFDPRGDFSSVDSFFAAMQTINGSDSTALRNTVLNAAGASVFTEEESSFDSERSHAAETIGFFTINAGVIYGSVLASNSFEVGIGGTAAGTDYDQTLYNSTTLPNSLNVTLTNGFVPSGSDVFFLLAPNSFFVGEFGNVQNGQRIETTAGEGTFAVAYSGNNQIILYDFEPAFVLGDANQDGVVNFLDISPFISSLSASGYLNEADTNRDGVVNFLDISPFIDILSQQ